MSAFSITPDLVRLVDWLRPKTQPWRAMTIAIDGVDHSGKSTVSRFLSWQLEMPVIETDLAFELGVRDSALVELLIQKRLRENRPVIVEGVFILDLLAQIGIEPEVVVNVEAKSKPRQGSWPERFAEYTANHGRSSTPDYRYVW